MVELELENFFFLLVATSDVFCCLFLLTYVVVSLPLPSFQADPVRPDVAVLLFFLQLLSWVTFHTYLPSHGSALLISLSPAISGHQ